MRISDWSSDVCSSDLSNVYLDIGNANTVNANLLNDVTTVESVVAYGAAGSSVFSATKMGSGTSVDQQTIQALPSINGNIQDYKIGRASCRERVCQYV